jgi:hypothetical protein
MLALISQRLRGVQQELAAKNLVNAVKPRERQLVSSSMRLLRKIDAHSRASAMVLSEPYR